MAHNSIRPAHVQVESLARRLMQQQEDAAATEQQRFMVNTHRVSRVPEHIRDHCTDAYTPKLITIGSLYARDAKRRLRAGNRLKMTYIRSLISRGHPDPSCHLDVIQGYVRLVAAREWEARAMYAAEDVDDISAEDFILMLVLDGCFIIEHLVNVATGNDEPTLDATPFGGVQVSVDLILAENQIPFFVLVDLINSTRLPEFDITGYQPTQLLMKLVQCYLAGEKGRDMVSEELPDAGAVSHILHLLHAMVTLARTRWEPPPRLQDAAALRKVQEASRLLRRLPLMLLVFLLHPTVPEEYRWSRYWREDDLSSASELNRMWVQLRKAHSGSNSKGKAPAPAGIVSVLGPVPLAVKLEHNNRLNLPQLRIDFRTAPLLLNLLAFEQSADQRAGDVSAYVWLMAKLVQSPEDAGVLLAAEVVTSSESKEDVARLFKRMGAASEAAAELDKSYLGETLHKLRERTSNRLAEVQRYYINVPWRLVAAFVTVVTTVSSILQTYAAFKQRP